ncbi:MAG: hybrid sensor histidine kinase/response regulator [Planctomycetales bacterium]|nr:hybrid sensor histidine kinase/response regulator [Planctomycetales bacterium]
MQSFLEMFVAMIDSNPPFLTNTPSPSDGGTAAPPSIGASFDQPTSAAPVPTIQKEHEVDNESQLNVLVIEDDDVDFMHLARNLRHWRNRFALSHATSLGAAIKEMESRSFDVVLTDLHLPDSVGLETVTRIRKVCDSAPILVLSGLNDETMEQEILDAGAQDYLPKSDANSSWTRKAIEHALQRQRSINEMNRITAELQTSHLLLKEQSEAQERDNQKLERLYQTGHEFLAKASHDIRGPLTVIKEHVSIVRDGLAGRINTEQATMLEKAMIRTDDVNSKLDDLLDSSKLDSGILDVCRRTCSVGDILDQTRTSLSQRAAMSKVTLDFKGDLAVPFAYCDEQKACRVLTGIGINAINACRESGHVSIWVRHDHSSSTIRIGVTDNGVGIMPQHRDLLAARFARPGLITEPDDKVLGLGLSIAARFCRLNLGQLHVESEVGLGSIFWFDIPTVDSPEIFPRWLELHSEPMRYIQLLSFCMNEDSSPAEKRDVELLLTYLTDNDELLIQNMPNQWWLASSSLTSNANVRLKEAKKEIARLADVRAASPDFDVKIESRAIWDLRTPRSKIIEAYRQVTGGF